jgi:hypothetical protein
VHVTGGRRSGDMQMACHAVTRSSTSTVQTTSNVPEYSKAKNIIHLSQRDQIVEKECLARRFAGRRRLLLSRASPPPPFPPPSIRAPSPLRRGRDERHPRGNPGRAPPPEPGTSAATGTGEVRRRGPETSVAAGWGRAPRAKDERVCPGTIAVASQGRACVPLLHRSHLILL